MSARTAHNGTVTCVAARTVAFATVFSLVACTVGAFVGRIGFASTFTVDDLNASEASALAIGTNNLGVAIVMIAIGCPSVSLGAAALLGMNGVVIGSLVGALLDAGATSILVSGLLPHAVFELLGFAIIAGATALPGTAIVRALTRGAFDRQEFRALAAVSGTTIAAGIALLLVAAVVEGSISTVHIP